MARALEGITVLEFSQVMAGPFCCMLLGDLGADVIKVEPREGDTTRKIGRANMGFNPAYAALNRNKRSVVLNLKDDEGQEVARRLAERADILVESFRPGVMTKLGLDYPTVRNENPALIYTSITGFGQTGPSAHRGGFDLIAQGLSGIMSVTGEPGGPPVKCGIPVTDLGAGLLALHGALAALYHRERTGEGQWIDTSLLEAGIALSVWEAVEYFSGQGIPEPTGSAHRLFAPYQAIRCQDGYITVGAANIRTWERFAKLCGHPEWCSDPKFLTPADRVANRVLLIELIEEVMTQRSRSYWLERCEGEGIPAGPILDYGEVFADEQVLARDMVWEYEHEFAGKVRTTGNPVKMSASSPEFRLPPPSLGEHTREVLTAMGYGEAEIESLIARGAVGSNL